MEKKRPKNIENPESFYAETPKWVFRNMDINHERWSLKSCDEIYSYVIEKLKDFEGQTWGEIIKQVEEGIREPIVILNL